MPFISNRSSAVARPASPLDGDFHSAVAPAFLASSTDLRAPFISSPSSLLRLFPDESKGLISAPASVGEGINIRARMVAHWSNLLDLIMPTSRSMLPRAQAIDRASRCSQPQSQRRASPLVNSHASAMPALIVRAANRAIEGPLRCDSQMDLGPMDT